MSVQDQLKTLIERHCAALGGHVEEIGGKLSEFVRSETDHAARLDDLVALTHKLNGSSGSIGFREVATVAAALEEHLADLAFSPERPDPSDLARALQLFNALERAVSQAKPEDSALYRADIASST